MLADSLANTEAEAKAEAKVVLSALHAELPPSPPRFEVRATGLDVEAIGCVLPPLGVLWYPVAAATAFAFSARVRMHPMLAAVQKVKRWPPRASCFFWRPWSVLLMRDAACKFPRLLLVYWYI